MDSSISLFVNKIVEFLMRDYMEEEVKVEVLGRNLKVFTHEGFIDLTRGSEYVLPRWLAYMLSKEGLVRVREEEYGIEKLSNIAYNEEATVQKLQLMKIPRYFYILVKKDIERLREKLKDTADLTLLDEYKQREDLIYTIGRIRIKKIMNYIMLPTIPQEILDKMSEEEKILYTMLKDMLSAWTKSLGLEKA